MPYILGIAMSVVYLVFLWRVFTEIGFLWGLGCLFLPFLSLVVVFLHWDSLRGYFIAELLLAVGMVLLE